MNSLKQHFHKAVKAINDNVYPDAAFVAGVAAVSLAMLCLMTEILPTAFVAFMVAGGAYLMFRPAGNYKEEKCAEISQQEQQATQDIPITKINSPH